MLKFLDRIQTASMMRMKPFEEYISEKQNRDNRAAGNNTERKATNKASSDINAANSNATPVGEAAMAAGSHIKDQDPGVINLGFGVEIDTKKMRGPAVDPAVFQAASQAVQGGVPTQNGYLDFLAANANAAAAAPAPGTGRHKVDNPVTPKPEVKKAEADQVNVDLGNINVETNPPAPPKQWPEVVNNQLPQAEGVQQVPSVPAFDNSAVTSRANCRYLGDIEKLALECGVQIQMIARAGTNGEDSGLITCVVYTPESPKPNPYKGFTIDTGMIIDRRAKVFPGIVQTGFEDMPAFPVLVPKDDNNENGKGKNVLNEKLFRDIFTGGVQMVQGMRSMYTPDFMELNKNVAIITMPTNNMNKDIRLTVRNRLMAAMEAGVFESAKQIDPYARFRFKHYDKKTQSFTLTTAGTPYRFCGPVQSTREIEIEFNAEGKAIINTIK